MQCTYIVDINIILYNMIVKLSECWELESDSVPNTKIVKNYRKGLAIRVIEDTHGKLYKDFPQRLHIFGHY